MGAISSWLNDKNQNKAVDTIVEDTHSRLRQRQPVLDEYMPIKTYDSRNFLAYVVQRINTLASVISYGGEIPTTRQGKLRKLTTQMVKIAIQRLYDEETQWEMLEAMELAAARGVEVRDRITPDGHIIPGVSQSMAQYIFGNIEDLVTSIYDTVNVMAWQCLQYNKVNFVDFRNNTTTLIDWADPEADYDHFPTALTQLGDTADKSLNTWTDVQYADGIQLLVNDCENFHETNGFFPGCIAMSRQARNNLLRLESTKIAARSISTAPQGTVSPKLLQDILDTRELPMIKTFDELYELENVQGDVIKGRFLQQNRYVFLTKGMGERAFGVTMESKEDLHGKPKTGVYVKTETVPNKVEDVTKAVATAVPIIVNAKLTGSRQVYS